MVRKWLSAAGGALLLLFALGPGLASAHQTTTIGAYDVEYGWLNEPVIINQPNAIVINITPHVSADAGHLSLMAPADGASVQGDQVQVNVQLDSLPATAAADGVHWHLMLDNQLLAMEPLDQISVTVSGLTNGDHTFEAMLASASHATIGTPATAKVTISGASGAGALTVSGSADMGGMAMGPAPTPLPPQNVDVSGLRVEATYGGQTKVLTLQPLSEDTPGQFIAPLLPTQLGQLTIQLSGRIGNSDIPQPVQVEPEEIEGADTVAFPALAPVAASNPGLGLQGWLGLGGLVFGLAGMVLGAIALFRRK